MPLIREYRNVLFRPKICSDAPFHNVHCISFKSHTMRKHSSNGTRYGFNQKNSEAQQMVLYLTTEKHCCLVKPFPARAEARRKSICPMPNDVAFRRISTFSAKADPTNRRGARYDAAIIHHGHMTATSPSFPIPCLWEKFGFSRHTVNNSEDYKHRKVADTPEEKRRRKSPAMKQKKGRSVRAALKRRKAPEQEPF